MCTLHPKTLNPKTLKTLNLNLDQSLQLANEKQSFSFTEPLEEYPKYLGQFNTNYIIFESVEIFKNYFFQIKKYCER
jgi:hypothetical protein